MSEVGREDWLTMPLEDFAKEGLEPRVEAERE